MCPFGNLSGGCTRRKFVIGYYAENYACDLAWTLCGVLRYCQLVKPSEAETLRVGLSYHARPSAPPKAGCFSSGERPYYAALHFWRGGRHV
jgi:hypothetical protein